MIKLTDHLPPAVLALVDETRGLGRLGLGILVGESGDFSLYRSPCGLWKRFGVAPDGEYAMTTKSGETAIAKPKRRRSALYTIGDSLIKGNKDGYRSVYVERKAYEVARNAEIKPIIAHRRAQRYMEKRLLKNLWRAWRGQLAAVTLSSAASPAPTEASHVGA